MPAVSRIGDGVQSRSELITFEWSIRDFFSLSDKAGDYYESHVFYFDGLRWCLMLLLNGKTSTGWVGLYLVRLVPGPPKTVHCTFGVKTSDGVEHEKKFKHKFLTENEDFGYPKCWPRIELENRKSVLLPSDTLTVTCDLRSNAIWVVKDPFCNGACAVSRNMKTILSEGKRADFTLKLGDREWPVHKLILESRCEYFANMFRHDWAESTVGEVTFEDIEEDALDSALHFVYAGAVEDMSVKNVYEIYIVAHKLLLEDLQYLCIEHMSKNMCVEIVCKALVIADTYEEGDLKKSAMEYFFGETSKIFDSEEWKELNKNHPSIVAELREEIMKRELKKRTK